MTPYTVSTNRTKNRIESDLETIAKVGVRKFSKKVEKARVKQLYDHAGIAAHILQNKCDQSLHRTIPAILTFGAV